MRGLAPTTPDASGGGPSPRHWLCPQGLPAASTGALAGGATGSPDPDEASRPARVMCFAPMAVDSYGEAVTWEPDRPRIRLLRTIVGWVVAAASVAVAAWLLPGVALERTGAAFLVAAVIAVLNAIAAADARGAAAAVHARARLPARAGRRRAGCCVLAADLLPDDIRRRLVRRRAARRAGDRGGRASCSQVCSAPTTTTSTRCASSRRIARRQGSRSAPTCPGILFLEIDGLALPVLRDAMRDGSAPDDGALDRRGRLPADRVGDRPLLADRRQPGRASCSAPTRTSPPSAGSRRRPGA